MLLYSCTRLAITFPHAISILYVLAVTRGCLIVKKDSSKGSIRVKEPFIDKIAKAN